MDTKIYSPVRKKVQVAIISADTYPELQTAVNTELETIFADPIIYEVMEIKYSTSTGLFAFIHYYEVFQYTADLP